MVMISTIEHERDDTKRDCDDHANDACTTTNNVLCVFGVRLYICSWSVWRHWSDFALIRQALMAAPDQPSKRSASSAGSLIVSRLTRDRVPHTAAAATATATAGPASPTAGGSMAPSSSSSLCTSSDAVPTLSSSSLETTSSSSRSALLARRQVMD